MNKSIRSFKQSAQAGFTLIELVVVIVILGILAATAIPKFVDMATDARIAKMQGAAAAMKSGLALFHAQWLVNGSPADTVAVRMEGVDVTGVNGYPAASLAGIGAASGVAAPDFQVSAAGTVTPDNTRTSCTVVYTAATVANGVTTPASVSTAGLTTANCK